MLANDRKHPSSGRYSGKICVSNLIGKDLRFFPGCFESNETARDFFKNGLIQDKHKFAGLMVNVEGNQTCILKEWISRVLNPLLTIPR